MDVRRSDNGTCYVQDCVGDATWLVIGLRMTQMHIHGNSVVSWDVMMCEDHAFLIGLRDEGFPVAPGTLVVEEEF